MELKACVLSERHGILLERQYPVKIDCALSERHGIMSEKHDILSERDSVLSGETCVLSEKADVLSERHSVLSEGNRSWPEGKALAHTCTLATAQPSQFDSAGPQITVFQGLSRPK